MDDEKAYKAQENRLRRAARRQGLQLVKNRGRNPRADDHGTYLLADPYGNSVVAGPGMTIDQVERALAEREDRPAVMPRDMLAEYLENAARWRDTVYHEDKRNVRSAGALRRLAAWVRSEATEEEVAPLAAMPAWFADGVFAPGEAGNRRASLYGFHRSSSPDDLFQGLLEDYRAEQRERRRESVEYDVRQLAPDDEDLDDKLFDLLRSGTDEQVDEVAAAVKARDLETVRRLVLGAGER
jgi:hypothetical protein